MEPKLAEIINSLSPRITQALQHNLPHSSIAGCEPLNNAISFAVLTGGKRMRPILCLLGARLAKVRDDETLPLACAVEYLHAASLIFDDMPFMDDAAERRGMPPLHERFGQGMATLAALALLNQCYALLSQAPESRALIRFASQCIGHDGMIAGQTLDLLPDASRLRSAAGENTPRYLKTAALLRLAVAAGAVGHGAEPADIAALTAFGDSMGAAYQMLDDAQDFVADSSRSAAWTGEPEDEPARLRALALNSFRAGIATLEARFAGRPELPLLTAFGEFIFKAPLATGRQ